MASRSLIVMPDDAAKPILEAFCRTITHLGPTGAGQAAKAVNQILISGTYAAVGEGLAYAVQPGLFPAPAVRGALELTIGAALRSGDLGLVAGLGDARAAPTRQGGDEAMQFAVETDLTEDLAAITFHAAVVVVQSDAGQAAHEPIENARRNHFVRRVMTHLLPTAHKIKFAL